MAPVLIGDALSDEKACSGGPVAGVEPEVNSNKTMKNTMLSAEVRSRFEQTAKELRAQRRPTALKGGEAVVLQCSGDALERARPKIQECSRRPSWRYNGPGLKAQAKLLGNGCVRIG